MSSILERATAALLQGQPASNRRREGRSSRTSARKSQKKPTFASVTSTLDRASLMTSQYTGLPKGPGTEQEQEDILKEWEGKSFSFPTVKAMDAAAAASPPVMPTATKRVRRLNAMCGAFDKFRTGITPLHLAYLASSPRRTDRFFYRVVCSVYGTEAREAAKSKKERKYAPIVTDDETLRALKVEGANLQKLNADLQQEWQEIISTFKAKHANRLEVMSKVTARLGEIHARLSGAQALEAFPTTPPTAHEALRRSRSHSQGAGSTPASATKRNASKPDAKSPELSVSPLVGGNVPGPQPTTTSAEEESDAAESTQTPSVPPRRTEGLEPPELDLAPPGASK